MLFVRFKFIALKLKFELQFYILFPTSNQIQFQCCYLIGMNVFQFWMEWITEWIIHNKSRNMKVKKCFFLTFETFF